MGSKSISHGSRSCCSARWRSAGARPADGILHGSLAVIFLFLFGNSAILNMMPSRIFPFMTDYQLSAVPLFIFMAAMLEKAGIIEELFDAVYKWLGAVKGGLRPRRCWPDGARRDGWRRRRHRSHHGYDRVAGHAQARL